MNLFQEEYQTDQDDQTLIKQALGGDKPSLESLPSKASAIYFQHCLEDGTKS